jgi:hypothetical protein
MKNVLLALVLIASGMTASAQVKINGVQVEKTISVDGKNLVLNGAGMREKLWFDLYVGALYLESKSSNGSALTTADQAMAITLDITDDLVTQDAMVDAVQDGFDESCSSKERKAIKKEIDDFIKLFSDQIVKGDHFVLAYMPGKGTMVSKNGKALGTIKGMNFKKGLFGIWLGEDPVDDELKEGMLGKA